MQVVFAVNSWPHPGGTQCLQAIANQTSFIYRFWYSSISGLDIVK